MSSNRRVLVVDDEKLIRWTVGEHLRRAGFTVETAESGEAAIEALPRLGAAVMLLDVRLPGMDGVATLRRALTLCPEVVTIMMSAHSTIDVAVEAMKHGAIDFLVKPFPFSTLDLAVDRATATLKARQGVATASARTGKGVGTLVGDSPQMEQGRKLVCQLAASPTTVLIEGESGSGKDVVARAIHYESARASQPFMHVNCAALPEPLLESELFGHERGAFTDARTRKCGLFETAQGGTVMLDEIGDLPPGGQAKLLLLLESKTFRRVGGVTELRADVRLIAATNVNLQERVAQGRFRQDLFFRLNVVRLYVPPLREREADIAPLAAFFIARYNDEMSRAVRGVAPAAMDLMRAYSWPGNVRELRNVIERAFILHPDASEIRPEHLPSSILELEPRLEALPSPMGMIVPLGEAERRLISEAMEKARGNQTQAARMLGVTRDTLRYRLKKFGMV